MKPTNLLAIALLLQLPAVAAVSLDAKDENSVLQNSDPALTDINKGTGTPTGKAEQAFAAGEFEEAIRLAKPRVEAGDLSAIHLMGFAYETGKGVPQSSEKALEYYRQAAEKGYADSIYRLAINLASSTKPADVSEARTLLEKQAEKDPTIAGRILGELFVRGRFSEKPDPEAGVTWWKKASAAGDVASMNFLAAFYEGQMGFPEKVDLAASYQYYGAAAAKGDTSAMINLGSRLLTGDEKKRNEKEGREWLAKAIAAKNPAGHLALGMYLESEKKDPKAALAEYSKGAEADQVDSMIRAAAMHMKGEGTEKDETRAMVLLEKAATAGSAQAHLELAGLILNKEKPDFAKGYAHLLTAANGGLAFAQNELGIFYVSGKFGVADVSAAASWFGRAAQGGFAAAQYNLAALHERGAAVPQSFETAIQLYDLAAQQKHPGATLALARLNAAGAGTKKSPEIAWALATIAGELGDENAAAFIKELEKDFTKEQVAAAKKELDRLKTAPKTETTETPEKPEKIEKKDK